MTAFPVRVLEPQVHVPPGVVEKGTPLALSAASNCSSATCTAILTWTDAAGQHQAVPMAAERQVDGARQYRATIPATDTVSTVS